MKRLILPGLVIACAIAFFLSPFASQSPDGLERVAGDKASTGVAEGKSVLNAPLSDYVMPGIRNKGLATALSGLAGTLITFGAAFGLAYALRKGKNES